MFIPGGDDWQTNACNTEDSAVADTTPVDTFKEMTNAFDVVDTLGNVLEWTSDIFPSAHNPTHSSTYHVAKGGSWVSEKDVCLFSRFKIKADAPSNILGFRCVAD
jgi:formylglycine-generating enzyme required for sulfatase activity